MGDGVVVSNADVVKVDALWFTKSEPRVCSLQVFKGADSGNKNWKGGLGLPQ